jgi:hypothetical protein
LVDEEGLALGEAVAERRDYGYLAFHGFAVSTFQAA